MTADRCAASACQGAIARLALALLVMGLGLLTRLPELDRYATIDESRWVSRSADFASYVQQRDYDKTFLVGHPGVTTMWLGSLGLGSERVRAFSYLEGQTDVTRRAGYLEALEVARLGPLVANAIALGGLIWLAWGLLGPGPALVGSVVLLGDPFLAAHSRFIHLDALLTSFMGLAALASIAFWAGRSWGYLVVAGLATGLALLTKAPSIFLLAFVPGLALLQHFRRRSYLSSGDWVRLLAGLLAWLALAYLVCIALWPAFRLHPLVVVRQMVEFTARNGSGERDNFFLGRAVDDPGPLFYPVALAFRLTPLALIGLGILAFALSRRQTAARWWWPTLLMGGYAVGFGLMMTIGQKKFDRYLLPTLPALDLLSGLGLWLGWRALAARRRDGETERRRDGETEGRRDGETERRRDGETERRRDGETERWRDGETARRRAVPSRYLSVSLSLFLVTAASWPLLSVYPYHLAYYNPLLGGGAAAQRAVFVGWGEGMDRVAAYLNAKPIVLQAPNVATPYQRVLQAHLNGNGALPIERAELADYIVPYVNSLQRDQKADLLWGYIAGQAPEYVVWINGIEYARVYRGPRLPVEAVVGTDFGPRVRLESQVFAPGSRQARPGDDLLIRLRWKLDDEPVGLVAGLRLTGPDGRSAVETRQSFADALRESGLFVTDAVLGLPAGLAPGVYQLQVLVEDDAAPRPLAPAGTRGLTIQQVVLGPAVPR